MENLLKRRFSALLAGTVAVVPLAAAGAGCSSTSGGNAANIEAALITAKMMGITTVLLTGNKHGLCEKYADMIIDAPAGETFIIQEYHLAIYHALCSEVENAFFEI